MTAFENARQGHRLKVIARAEPSAIAPHSPAVPDMQFGYFLSMCDDTGLFQHAVYSVPDRAHGYCVDDNARALLLACALNGPGEHPLSEILTARFAAFVQHAWNPDTRRFRNFMGFNRTWLEEQGLRRQSRAYLVGAGRMRAEGCKPLTASMGGGPVCRSPADRRGLSLASRNGLRASRSGCLLRRSSG